MMSQRIYRPIGKVRLDLSRFSHCQVGALHEKYRNEDLEKAVKPAFGFWLFPLEALGSITEEDPDRSEWPELCRMADYWPELALSNLRE
jgi:hypothetical protein